jgi:hypothetical protein
MTAFLDIEGCKNELIDSVAGLQNGYWVTLNALHKNEVTLNVSLIELSKRLNVFCYGNNFAKGVKKLAIRGALQRGNVYQGLHAHLIIMQNGETDRSFNAVEHYIRRQWYRLNGAKGFSNGNLVNVQPVSDVAARIDYALRDFSPLFDQRDQIVYL